MLKSVSRLGFSSVRSLAPRAFTISLAMWSGFWALTPLEEAFITRTVGCLSATEYCESAWFTRSCTSVPFCL